jgi:hypothetical protein
MPATFKVATIRSALFMEINWSPAARWRGP